MNPDRALEKAMKNPETRVKLYLAFNLGLWLVNISIAIGLVLLFLYMAGIL